MLDPAPHLSTDDAISDVDIFDHIGINNRKRIAEELCNKLRKAIISGKLPEGYIFPNENDLCKKLEIGRSTLREAYAPLETLHLITRTKSGTYVNKKADTNNSMNFDLIAQYTNPINMIEYRQIFEVGAARLAAQKAKRKHITELRTIVEAMERCGDAPEQLTELDFDFHFKLVAISANELLIISFNSIRLLYEKFVKQQFEKHMLPQSLVDHRALIEALVAGDPDQAGRLMTEHLEHIAKVARTSLPRSRATGD
ncbi:MAG: FadR family transcriptional regulator [Planctomycetaceae bacterium]|nr:FadR family transcriptional regulator [Planctomycetaceae bacterium]